MIWVCCLPVPLATVRAHFWLEVSASQHWKALVVRSDALNIYVEVNIVLDFFSLSNWQAIYATERPLLNLQTDA